MEVGAVCCTMHYGGSCTMKVAAPLATYTLWQWLQYRGDCPMYVNCITEVTAGLAMTATVWLVYIIML
jgi:hypothetical protein